MRSIRVAASGRAPSRGPKEPPAANDHDLFRLELVSLPDPRHELIRLAELTDCQCLSAGSVGSSINHGASSAASQASGRTAAVPEVHVGAERRGSGRDRIGLAV